MTTRVNLDRATASYLWGVFPLLLLIPSMIWIWQDYGSWMWDQASYADGTVRLYGLLKGSLKAWFHGMLSIDGGRASGLIWFGQFFVGLHQLLGNVERALRVYTLLMQAATLWIVFDMCSRLAGCRKFVGVACALLVASAPLFVGIGHQYFVENLQILAVAWLWQLAIISPNISRWDLIVMVALALALGMAAKVTTPIFAGPPFILAVLGASGWFLPRSENPRMLRPVTRIILLVFLVLTAGLVCTWYVYNIEHLLAHMIAASGKTGIYWGTDDPFPAKFWRWLCFLRISFLPGFLLYAGLAVAAVGLFRLLTTRRFERRADLAALGGLVSIFLTISVYSLSTNEDYRFALPLLPPVAVIFAWVLTKTPRSLSLIFCVATLISGLAVHATALGIIPHSPDYTRYLMPVNADLRDEQLRPDAQAVRLIDGELARLTNLTSTPETDNRPQICAVQYSWLNCNLLKFYASKGKLLNGSFAASYATNGLGYGESDLGKALKYIETIRPLFIVSVREDMQPAPDFVNLVNLPLLAHLRNDSTYEQVEFPSELGIIVFRRSCGASEPGFSLLDVLHSAKKTIIMPGYCQIDSFSIGGERRMVVFQHPVPAPEVNEAVFENIPIRQGAKLTFGIALHPNTWSPEKGDGVHFSMDVRCATGQTRVFDRYIDPKNSPQDRRWHDFEVDLDEFHGGKIDLVLRTTPGPGGKNSYDWAGWSGLEIKASREVLPSNGSSKIRE